MRLIMMSFLIFCSISCQSEAKLTKSAQVGDKLTPSPIQNNEAHQIHVSVEIVGQSRLSSQVKSAIKQQSEVFSRCWGGGGDTSAGGSEGNKSQTIDSVQVSGEFRLSKSGMVSRFKILEMPMGSDFFKKCFTSNFSKLNFIEGLTIADAPRVGFYKVSFTWSMYNNPQQHQSGDKL